MKINKKLLTFGILGIFAIALVSALTYYSVFTASVVVNQPISVDGDLSQAVSCYAGESCLGEAIIISNDGEKDRVVRIVKTYGNEDIDVAYVGKLELTKKDTSTWEAIEGSEIELTYSIVGEDFEYEAELPENYVLIYYKDAVVGLEGRLDNPQPAIEIVSDIGSLPQSDDANLDADYSEAPDYYEHKTGSKIWAVPEDAINTDMTLDWSQMSNFYYETDLVYYFANADNELIVPAGSFLTFYPRFSPDKYIEGEEYNFEFEIQ